MIPPADDLDRIMAVMQAAFDPVHGEAWTRAQVENALLLGNCHYHLVSPQGIVGEDGEAAGFALLRTAFDEEELLLFAISPQWRRRGLGRALLLHAIADARARGIGRMLLEMRRGNDAENLYRAAGFEPVGLRRDYYRTSHGTRVDAITFARNIE